MADTPQSWGPKQFEGPFAAAITPPQVVSQPHESTTQFSGGGGRSQAVLGMLSKFLAGYGQGRAQRSLAEENAKNQKMQKAIALGQALIENPYGDQQLASQATKDLGAIVMPATDAALQEGGKHNPVLGGLQKVLGAFGGGEVKKSKFDEKKVDEFLAKYSGVVQLPQYTKQGQATQVRSQLMDAVGKFEADFKAKNNREPNSEELMQAIPKDLWAKAGGVIDTGKFQEEIERIYGKPVKKSAEEIKEEGLGKVDTAFEQGFRERTAPQAAPPPASTQAAAAPPPASQAQPGPQGGGQPAPAVGAPPLPEKSNLGQPPPVTVRAFPLGTDGVEVLKAHKALDPKVVEMVVNGEDKPRKLHATEGYVTPNHVAIPGGYVDVSTGELFRESQVNEYTKPKEPSEAEKQKQVEQDAYAEKHKLDPKKLTSTQKLLAHSEALALEENPETKALRNATLTLQEQRIREAKEQNAGEIPMRSPNAPEGARDETVLSGQPTGIQSLVKGMVEYNLPVPSGFALANPKSPWNKALQIAQQYDPTFSAAEYPTRLKLKQDFTSGKASENIRSLNTAVLHLESLDKAAKALNNSSFPLYNELKQKGKHQLGGYPELKSFDEAANAVESELARVFKGTSGTDQEIKEWRKGLNSANTPSEFKAAINTGIELLNGRVEALRSQYESGMHKPPAIPFLNTRSQQILDRLQGKSSGATTPSTAAPPPVRGATTNDPMGVRQ